MSGWEVDLSNIGALRQEIVPVVEEAKFIVAVTGAGISKASGLPLVDESVCGIPLKAFFEPNTVDQDPHAFFEAYRSILVSWRQARPNPAHLALARRQVWIITQNIDGLHRDAGTRHLIELHGNLRELHCVRCRAIYTSKLALRAKIPVCPACKETLRPGISLVGNEVRHWSRAVDWVGRAEVLLIVGTSLEMMPIAKLPRIMRRTGGHTVRVNDAAEQILPRLLNT